MPGVATSPATEAVFTTAPDFCFSMTGSVAKAQEYALDVHIDHLIEYGLLVFGDRNHLSFDASVIKEAIDATKCIERGPYVGLNLRRLGDIGHTKACLTALLLDGAGGALCAGGVLVHRQDLGPAGREGQRCCAPDSVTSTRNERYPAVELHGFPPEKLLAVVCLHRG